jgi:hypothetical protein
MAALSSLAGTIDDKEKPAPVAKAEKLALFDEALVFLRGGIGALQDK